MNQRDRQNLGAGIAVLLLIGLTYWVITVMTANARLEECLQQRRRNCEQLNR